MPRIRSLVTTVRIDVAQRAHDCQANGNHRLSKGDRCVSACKFDPVRRGIGVEL